MVQKRTHAFVTLAILVWALIATGFTIHYYMQNLTYQEELQHRQKLLDELAKSSEDSLTRWNLLAGEYSTLLGEYQWFKEKNYAPLMNKCEKLIVNLKGNYTNLLNTFPDLNETYNLLWQKYETLNQKPVVEKEEFGELLSDSFKLFTSLTLKEMSKSIGEAAIIHVSLLIDYGNTTQEWHNVTTPLGTTLFNLTKTVTKIEYSYWPAMEPGHIFVDSINNSTDGYWLWYYWDKDREEWVLGPVGCDAWMLKDGGVYKWYQSRP
jgi:hypothetical protein